MHRISQISVLGLVVFIIFTNDLEDGIKSTHGKCSDDTKLSGTRDPLDDRIKVSE